VRLRYAAKRAHLFPHHDQTGTVEIAASGRGPLNHLVRLDNGVRVVVPCGNLIKEGKEMKNIIAKFESGQKTFSRSYVSDLFKWIGKLETYCAELETQLSPIAAALGMEPGATQAQIVERCKHLVSRSHE